MFSSCTYTYFKRTYDTVELLLVHLAFVFQVCLSVYLDVLI